MGGGVSIWSELSCTHRDYYKKKKVCVIDFKGNNRAENARLPRPFAEPLCSPPCGI